MTHRPIGPVGPKPEPPQNQKSTPISKDDAKYAFLLQSPFAKMFTATGVQPTVKEIRGVINGILQNEINRIKEQDAEWKKTMEHLRKVIEGKDN